MRSKFVGVFIFLICIVFNNEAVAQTKKKQTKKKPVKKTASVATVAIATGNNHLNKPQGDYFLNNRFIHNNVTKADSMIKDPAAIRQLDQYIQSMIKQGVFPACQIFASKDGQVIYQKSFGHYNYDKLEPINDSSIFDIASVSKVVATTLAIMKLYEEEKINLNGTLKSYLKETIGTTKGDIKISELLLHQAGLKSWIPFYKNTLDVQTQMPREDLYATKADKVFNIPVSSNFFMNSKYLDTLWSIVYESELSAKMKYVYSDLDLMLLQKVVEVLTGQSLDVYVKENFFSPLGLTRTFFNPWKQGLRKQCVPTEVDQVFRLQQIQGYVHDPGAAMMGGVAGHAGVFSTAKEVGTVMQMLINGGRYKNHTYFKAETVRLFTGYQSNISRRAYGFDKPEKAFGNGGPAAAVCSKLTFGHQGFTGTCAWADPVTGIVFVFNSNRINPNADNNLINKLSVRTEAQRLIYKALGY